MKSNKKLNSTGRITLMIITAVFLLFFLLTGFMYADIAITGRKKGQNLYQYSLDLYLESEKIQGARGSIFDRDGVTLAEQLTSYTIYANLYEDYGKVVEDIEDTAKQLSTVLDLSEEQIIEILSKDAKEVEFGSAGRGLTYLEKELIDEMELSGIGFRENIRRLYPNGTFASHTIGYAQYDQDSNNLNGEMGVEAFFDDLLQGTEGLIEYLRDKKGYLQTNQEIYVVEEAYDGYDVYLTLDSTIQAFLEYALDSVWDEANPESLVAIVANPKTGEIMAMGSRSTFDPNIRDIENYNNPVISDAFEPGSTLKIYTYAAAINEGKYKGDILYESGQRTLFNGTTLKDYNQTWGTITYNEGFYRSSNTAIVDILQNWMEPDTFLEYLQAFGFGSEVGIELSGESPGSLPLDSEITQKITAGYGQGLLTTPIQHIQAITAILNEGQLIKPQLVSKIYDPNTEEIVSEFEVDVIGNPITAETAKQVKELMIGVVEDENGSARNLYDLDDISSGGKTGTAQIADGTKGYLAGEYTYSYIGFAPADDPELVMYLAMSRPETGTGHADLSQAYQFVMNYALEYLGLGEEKAPYAKIEDAYETTEVPNLLNQNINEAIKQLEALDLEPIVIGEREQVFAQQPKAKTTTTVGNKVFIQTDTTGSLPDFTGWSKSELNQYNALAGLNIEFSGEGFVVKQSIEPGELVSKGETLLITLEKGL